jgi:hypothetical protein
MAPDPRQYIYPGIIAAQAIHVAAKLRISDLLADGPKTAAELAESCGAHAPTLERLLRALGALDMFAATPDGRYQNTPSSETLRSDHPQSARGFALFLPAAFLWRPLGELYESVRTGQPAFPRIFGADFFNYLAVHPEDAALFDTVMTEGTAFTTPALLNAYDFSGFARLVDVGGGQGALLRDILSQAPALRGVLFDLPQVVAGASSVLTGETAARCEIVGGSFFDSVPAGADAYLLARIIHDWRDEDAARILRNVHRAMRPDSVLLLVEALADSFTRPAGLMELLMLVLGGCERTEAEFRALLATSGLSVTRIIPTELSSVIECHPA